MGKLVLYGVEESGPVRTVLLTLNALNLEYELQRVNIFNGEHKSEEFIKKNPQHTVPVLEDNGQFLWDSHAIVAYLVRKYAQNDTLYPKDFFKRAVVDQRLHFDSGVLFANLKSAAAPLFSENSCNIPQEKIDLLYESLKFLEGFLEHKYVAGEEMTIADFSIVSTVSSLEAIAPIDPKKLPNIIGWLNRMSELPYYDKANGRGAAIVTEMIRAKLSSK